jgi:hypothetical protein
VSDSCVAVVAQQSSDLAGVVAVIDGELVLPVVGLIVAWGLPAHAAHASLFCQEFVVLGESDAVAVLEVGVSTRDRIDARGAVPVSPLLLVVVRRTEPSAADGLSTPLGRTGNASPFPPLPGKATILWVVVRLRVLTHFSSPSTAARNGCLPFALTILPELVVILKTES